jgi:hypothetical protein
LVSLNNRQPDFAELFNTYKKPYIHALIFPQHVDLHEKSSLAVFGIKKSEQLADALKGEDSRI